MGFIEQNNTVHSTSLCWVCVPMQRYHCDVTILSLLNPDVTTTIILWAGISLLDVVGVVLTIFLVTYFTWKAGWFELSVDKNTYDATDYAVLVTGLPPDAGFHEVKLMETPSTFMK
eukprot:scaffold192534_cov15-Tisochrysis_lutea.AAC.3